MTDQNQQTDTGLTADEERALLEEKAINMGIQFNKNIGTDTLRARINKALLGDDAAANPEEDEAEKPPEVHDGTVVKPTENFTPAETNPARNAKLARMKAKKLVRVRITCMNPTKSKWSGEVFSLVTPATGTIRRHIPFNQPWHIEQGLLDMIKERKFMTFHESTDEKGRPVVKTMQTNEFAIEMLPALTETELKALGQSQLARNSIGG